MMAKLLSSKELDVFGPDEIEIHFPEAILDDSNPRMSDRLFGSPGSVHPSPEDR
jgi:hypothetical protein